MGEETSLPIKECEDEIKQGGAGSRHRERRLTEKEAHACLRRPEGLLAPKLADKVVHVARRGERRGHRHRQVEIALRDVAKLA